MRHFATTGDVPSTASWSGVSLCRDMALGEAPPASSHTKALAAPARAATWMAWRPSPSLALMTLDPACRSASRAATAPAFAAKWGADRPCSFTACSGNPADVHPRRVTDPSARVVVTTTAVAGTGGSGSSAGPAEPMGVAANARASAVNRAAHSEDTATA
jgi:hypothetical protein